MQLRNSTIFWPATVKGALTYGDSFYTRPTGPEKKCLRSVQTKNDLMDTMRYAFSNDNGASWSALHQMKVFETLPNGSTLRRWVLPSWVDPVNGRLLTLYNEAVMPHDDALVDGMTQTFLKYRVSLDGGRTDVLDDMIVQRGYTHEHPMRGVIVGKNAVMLGDNGCEPIRTVNGRILVPVQVCPLGPDGTYHNPGGGYSYHEAAVLIGQWHDHDISITWELSPYIANDPEHSTRGAVEPTIAQFSDGRILMVLRGSNDVKPHLPGYRWYTVSHDEGDSWEPVRPWTFHTGAPFFSPSSMSQLLRHSNGHCYWLGNIAPVNPRGNSPRYPLVIGRVDPESLLLMRESLFTVDDRRPGEAAEMTLSNFHAHEDRITGEIVLHMSRWLTRGPDDYTADALIYRIIPD